MAATCGTTNTKNTKQSAKNSLISRLNCLQWSSLNIQFREFLIGLIHLLNSKIMKVFIHFSTKVAVAVCIELLLCHYELQLIAVIAAIICIFFEVRFYLKSKQSNEQS